MKGEYPHILRKADIEAKAFTFSHPWNPKSPVIGTMMGRLAGLKRTGVSVVRVPPGKESFAYHLHHREEEWVYVLSGTAVTTIDGQEYTLEEGDFVAFPTLDRRLVRLNEELNVYRLSDGKPFFEGDA